MLLETPPDGWREQDLVLDPDPGPELRLTSSGAWRPEGSDAALPSQRIVTVSPDGRRVAYADLETGETRVRDADGEEIVVEDVWGRDVRFSPDADRLVALTGPKHRRDDLDVVVVDLSSGDGRVLGRLDGIRWIEWSAVGIVVLHMVEDGDRISILPFEGEPRVLARADRWSVRRVAAASRGTRVVYFADAHAWSIDLAHPARRARDLGATFGRVQNAESSPSGDRVAFTTPRGVYLALGDRAPRRVAQDERLHSLWFSADGDRLLWASPSGLTVVGRGDPRRLEAPLGNLRSARFHRGGTEIVTVQGDRAMLWDPGTNARWILGRARTGRDLVSADLFAGGVVLWTARWGQGS